MKSLYNICITILEAKYLAWIDIKTFVEIEIDGKKKSTKVKECSDRPFFNEYFVFEVKKSLSDLMSTDIEISMYKPSKKLHRKKFLASTRLDIGTIWNRKDHQFYHEWFTLRHRAKEKGFLQCDIRIVTPDSEPMHHAPAITSLGRVQTVSKKENIISEMAVYFLRIFRGGDMYHFDHSNKNSKISISITFCGMKVKTSDKKNTTDPVWNEEFKFLNPFPPVHHKLKLTLIVNDREVSSIAILMDEISSTHDMKKGFLPTFGPAYKYFYSILNTYQGYIILSLQTIAMRDGREDSKSSVMKRVLISGLVEEKHFGFQYFTCFCVIYEVSMLNKQLCLGQALSVSIELGREGLVDFNETSVTDSMLAEDADGYYCWLPIENEKPCLFLKDKLPDTRWRLFMTNSLKRMCNKLEATLSLVDKEELPSNKIKFLVNALKVLKADCDNFVYASGNTQLDKDRPKFINNLLSTISSDVSKIIKGNRFKKMYNKTKEMLEALKKFIKDPQDSLPSIIINIWKHNQRIYICRIPPEDVIYANTPDFCGPSCGQLKTIFLDELAPKHSSKRSRAKMVAYMWMGILNDMSHWPDKLPDGFTFNSLELDSSSFLERHSIFNIVKSRASLRGAIDSVPASVDYNVSFDCICLVYIEQAYFEEQFIFDSPGLNKVRVVFESRSSETQEVFGMQQIIWSELLSTAPVTLYGEKSYFKNHPPTLIIEVWQIKKKVSLVGNVCLELKFRPEISGKETRGLECHYIEYDAARVGKLLLCAELVEIDDEEKEEEYLAEFERMTLSSKTSTAMYRMEVYFWGVRDLMYQSVNACVTITVGNSSISSPALIIQKDYAHFSKQELIVKDMILPKSKHLSPMMIINLVDTIEFGTNKYTGCCAVDDIQQKFNYTPITRDDWQKLQNSHKQHFISAEKSNSFIEFSESDQTEKRFSEKVNFGPPALLSNLQWLLKRIILLIFDAVASLFSKYQNRGMKNNWKYRESLAEPVLQVTEVEKHDWWSKYFSSKKMAEEPIENNSERESITKYKTSSQPTLEFYNGELEKEFYGFTDCLKIFKLTHLEITEPLINTSVCKVKAAVVLYEVPRPEEHLMSRDGHPLNKGHGSHVLPGVVHSSQLTRRLLLRIYIAHAYNLFSKQGQPLNPYIAASVPSATIESFATYLADQSNPCFGFSFELIAELPKDYELTIKVMNFVRFGKDELIGETKVDLENRYYTKHRARCGLQTSYNVEGFNSWRDQFRPSEILERLCEENYLPPPIILPHCVIVAGKEFIFPKFEKNVKEAMCLHVLLRWEEIPIVGCTLVREHVETRPLYNPHCPGIIQGYIEMWVDIFDLSGPPPMAPLLDITPREPQAFELRVIIYKTCKVYLVDNDISLGYKHSDIYVKGWMQGKADMQSTDVHFKSITGDGDFNWRFIFPFKYLPAEGCITLTADSPTAVPAKKKRLLSKIPPRVYLQVCDRELLFPDQFIGLFSLDLRYMIKGASRWWLCKSYVDESPKNTLNLFEERKTRGWWPFYGSQRFMQTNKITGYLEAEFHLVTYFEALRSPVGYGRNEPDGLIEPTRKILRYTFWLLPCRVMLHMVGLNKLTIMMFLAIFGVILFVMLGIYAVPSTVVQRIIGGRSN